MLHFLLTKEYPLLLLSSLLLLLLVVVLFMMMVVRRRKGCSQGWLGGIGLVRRDRVNEVYSRNG